MITRETVTFKDSVMRVARHDGAHDVTAPDAMPDVSEPGAIVEVSNIPSNVRQETLTMLFENAKRSGGGDIEKIDFVQGSERALITFKDSAGTYPMTLCLIEYTLQLSLQLLQ